MTGTSCFTSCREWRSWFLNITKSSLTKEVVLKISMVSEHASPLAALGGVDAGGQNVHVAELSSALVRRGHDVTVFTRRDDPQLPATTRFGPGVKLVHVDAGPASHVPKDEMLPWMPELAVGIVAQWGSNPPDIVHGHFWMSGVASLDAATQCEQAGLRRPLVAETFHALGTVKRRHQGDADTSPPERAGLEPWVGQSVDMAVATCSDEVFELKAMGVQARSIAVAPCGVDTALFRPHGPMEVRRRRYRIATIGRLVPRKGVGTAVTALALLAELGFADVELMVVGGVGGPGGISKDPEAIRIMALANDLGVADRVIMRGQLSREQIPALLRSVDAVVCTPWYEPFGIVPLEAMACGRPVVAAAVGGLKDSVVHGLTGLHVRPRNPQEVAEALVSLLADPSLARQLGEAGVRRVQSRYTWDNVAAATEKIYSRMTQTRERGTLQSKAADAGPMMEGWAQ